MAGLETSFNSLPPLAPKISNGAEKPAEPAAVSKRGRIPKDKDKEKDKDAEEGIGIEELSMPRSIITRLAKSALPPGTAVGKDAILALSKCATVFISLLAAGAQDNLEKVAPTRKTVLPGNVLAAAKETEFDWLVQPLENELEMYLVLQNKKKEENRRKAKEGAAHPDGSTMLVGDEDSVFDAGPRVSADPGAQLEAESNIDRERSAKRGKVMSGEAVTRGDDDEEEDVEMDDRQDEIPDEEEADEDATEDEDVHEPREMEEDRVGTEPEDEPDDQEGNSEEDSD